MYQAQWTRSRTSCSKQIQSVTVILFCSGPCLVTWHCKHLHPLVHSEHSLPGNNHLLCKLVKTFAITKGIAGNSFCFRVFQFHLLSSFSRLFSLQLEFYWNWYKICARWLNQCDWTSLWKNNTPASYVIDPGLKSRYGCRFPHWGVYGFLQFLQRNSRRVLQFRPRRFVPHCVQFIFHLLF